MAQLILQMDHPTMNGRKDGHWFSYLKDDLVKTITQMIADIDTTPDASKGETQEEVDAKVAFLTFAMQQRCLQLNPDFDQEAFDADPENYVVPQYIFYDCTVEEFHRALNTTLGPDHVKTDVAVEDEAAAPKFKAMLLPKMEPYKKDLVDGGAPIKSEIDLFGLFGRGFDAPNKTIHSDNGAGGMGQWLRKVKSKMIA